MKTEFAIIDCDDVAEKSRAMSAWGALRGLWKFTWKPYRPTRSLKANAYYFGPVLGAFQAFLAGQGEHYTTEQLHELCKNKFLRESVVDPRTGEVIGETTASTRGMDTAEFSDYLEKVIVWLQDMFGIVIPSPDQFHHQRAEAQEQKA